ncbi:MAG: AbrB/MazE/SpoVT family DNA-binding domain-containing protein [Bifidobacteriaceae bacterium]|jgi:bifunctional DNA-binding transcriptional regulator/antitoxin component of YhaV-PrlF toxin-antitoxin module|nr:AbrB/MazE/SpoVT family DNA-binding domain-containing protein [Bifidobacteriaceae bacterium]
MSTLKVTSRGQVTFRHEVLRHLGVEKGSKIDVSLAPGNRVVLTAPRQTGSIDGFIGLLAGKTDKVATIEEINEAIAAGWANQA